MQRFHVKTVICSIAQMSHTKCSRVRIICSKHDTPTDFLFTSSPSFSHSRCLSVFSPLAVSLLDNNNLPHRAHYSIKEGLRENTDQRDGRGALGFDSLLHLHEKKQLRGKKKQEINPSFFPSFSLTGNLFRL